MLTESAILDSKKKTDQRQVSVERKTELCPVWYTNLGLPIPAASRGRNMSSVILRMLYYYAMQLIIRLL